MKFPILIYLLTEVIKSSFVLDKDKLRMICKIKKAKKLANFCPVTSTNSLGRNVFFPCTAPGTESAPALVLVYWAL